MIDINIDKATTNKALNGLERQLRGYTGLACQLRGPGTVGSIRAFCDANGTSGSYYQYRAAVMHLFRWARFNRVTPEAIDAEALEAFRMHECTTYAGRVAPLPDTTIAQVSRYLVYLQYQGLLPCHGWSAADSNHCRVFERELLAAGFSDFTASLSTYIALHFITWLRLRQVEREAVDDAILTAFAHHRCRCGVQATLGSLRSQSVRQRYISAFRFLRFLNGGPAALRGDRGVHRIQQPELEPLSSPRRYEAWLREDRGLVPLTIRNYMADLAKYLVELGEDASRYSAESIRSLVLGRLDDLGPVMQSRLIRSVRSYLTFRAWEGHCRHDLADCLISRPVYRLGSLPRHIDKAAIEQIIATCDLTKAVGRRDQAVMLLLAELGLRAIEVVRLRLGDIDWEGAQLRIAGKGGRASVMPLTQRAGDALLAYLSDCRPHSDDDAIFIRHQPPAVAIQSSTITSLVEKARDKCPGRTRGAAHVFRHSLATNLLRAGHDLQEVATVLRHRSLETTLIYAKVDEHSLKSVAQKWQGDVTDA